MDISFRNKKLKKLCTASGELTRQHGAPCAKKAETHLANLAAAPSLAEFGHLPGRCHELDGNRSGQLALVLADGKRLVFEPTADPVPVKRDGGLDWAAVQSVRILAVEDYH